MIAVSSIRRAPVLHTGGTRSKTETANQTFTLGAIGSAVVSETKGSSFESKRVSQITQGSSSGRTRRIERRQRGFESYSLIQYVPVKCTGCGHLTVNQTVASSSLATGASFNLYTEYPYTN